MARTSREQPPSPGHRREEQVPGGSGREQLVQGPKVSGWEGFGEAMAPVRQVGQAEEPWLAGASGRAGSICVSTLQ